jgi:hypothetical protein
LKPKSFGAARTSSNENEPIDELDGAKKILANAATSAIPLVNFEKNHHDHYQKVQKGVLWEQLNRYFVRNEKKAEESSSKLPTILHSVLFTFLPILV